MKPGLYDDLVTENLIREIENLKADGIVPLFGKIEAAHPPDRTHEERASAANRPPGSPP